MSFSKKARLSRIAVACSMALAVPLATAAGIDISNKKYETYQYIDGVVYQGYVGNNHGNNTNTNIFSDIHKASVSGVLSTYYLGRSTNGNTLNISDTYLRGMITSDCLTKGGCGLSTLDIGYQPITLNIVNSTIDDRYEYFSYTETNSETQEKTQKTFDTYDYGVAINLDREAAVNIQRNSHVAGLYFEQGYQIPTVDSNNTFNVDINVKDSVVTSGAISKLTTKGLYGQSEKPSDYRGDGSWDDVALVVNAASVGGLAKLSKDSIVPEDGNSLTITNKTNQNNSMRVKADFSNSSLLGDVVFVSLFNSNYYYHGAKQADGTMSNGVDGTDTLDLTLDNGSKWTGRAISDVQYDDLAHLYTTKPNSIWPWTIQNSNGLLTSAQVRQSGLFNVTLNNNSIWNNAGASELDILTVNNGSIVNVKTAGGYSEPTWSWGPRAANILADEVHLNNHSQLNIGVGSLYADLLAANSYSTIDLQNEAGFIRANNININSGAELKLGQGNLGTRNLSLTNHGVFDVGSRDFTLNSDLNNGQTATHFVRESDRYTENGRKIYAESGIIALNSNGHLTVDGIATGNYLVRIDNATGEGNINEYQGKEVILTRNDVHENSSIARDNSDKDNNPVYDHTRVAFHAANEADLGAYRYHAQQQGDRVQLTKRGLTSSANAALSIPSASANVWHLENDTVENRQTNLRQLQGKDTGGVWLNYFGGKFEGDRGSHKVDYDQTIHGVAVGIDSLFESGDGYSWLLGGAVSFAKADIDVKNGDVDQDSQSARLYTAFLLDNGLFVNGSLSYSHYSNDLNATMSNGAHVTGDTDTNAWGVSVKAGYDWKFQPNASLTPYASFAGVFVGNDNYRLSNGMRVSEQSYDSMRYEVGADLGYNIELGNDTFTPYLKLAYVYNGVSSDSARINGDRIINSLKGSAVRVGLGAQYDLNKKFSVYADTDYMGGSDIEQPWSANVGMKYHF